MPKRIEIATAAPTREEFYASVADAIRELTGSDGWGEHGAGWLISALWSRGLSIQPWQRVEQWLDREVLVREQLIETRRELAGTLSRMVTTNRGMATMILNLRRLEGTFDSTDRPPDNLLAVAKRIEEAANVLEDASKMMWTPTEGG